MPMFDRTGPMGMGPRTGWGCGPCGCGMGWMRKFGRGRGMGRCCGWNLLSSREDQLQALKEYKQALKEELGDIEKEEKEFVSKK